MDFDRVSLHGVGRFFGRRRALSHVTWTCRAARVAALVGPNGAGKSTLVALLAGALAPSTGEIRYGTATIADAGPGLRGAIGLLAHDLHLYTDLTAAENLEFFAALFGLSAPARAARAALEHAGLAARANDAVGGFSRGMRQRLALERALLHEPRLVLLDEPFTGLDETSAAALVARLRGLRAEGRIVVLATHDLEAVEGLIDDLVLVRDGRVRLLEEAAAPLRERYRRALAP